MDRPIPQTALVQWGWGRWRQSIRCRCPSIFNRIQIPWRLIWWSLWGQMVRRQYLRPQRHRDLRCRRQRGRSFIRARRRIVVIKIVKDFKQRRLRWQRNCCQGHQRWQDNNSGGYRNTGARGGSIEWLRFLSPRVQTEALGAVERPKYPCRKLQGKKQAGKSKSIIARKVNASQKIVTNSSKIAWRKKRGFIEGSATTTSGRAR